MSSAVYDKGREGILDDTISMSTASVKAVLVDTGAYTVDLANHDFLDDIPSGARIGTSGALQNKTFTKGVFDADDIDITVGASQPSAEACVIFVDTGVAGTSRLVAYIDSATGLPYTPAAGGGTAQMRWDSGANKIFKL